MTEPRYDDEGRGRRRGAAWWWWVLAALLLLAILILLLARGCGDDDGDGGSEAGGGSAQVETGSGSATDGNGDPDRSATGTTGTDGGGETGDLGGGSGDGSGGTLTDEGGRDLLALAAQGGSLASVADARNVQGQGVRVQSVVGDEVFWVGTSKQDRWLVHLVIGGESPPQVKADQRVSFSGRLLTLPAGASRTRRTPPRRQTKARRSRSTSPTWS